MLCFLLLLHNQCLLRQKAVQTVKSKLKCETQTVERISGQALPRRSTDTWDRTAVSPVPLQPLNDCCSSLSRSRIHASDEQHRQTKGQQLTSRYYWSINTVWQPARESKKLPDHPRFFYFVEHGISSTCLVILTHNHEMSPRTCMSFVTSVSVMPTINYRVGQKIKHLH